MQAQLANQIKENNDPLKKNDKWGLKAEVWDSMGVIFNESNEIVEDNVACLKYQKYFKELEFIIQILQVFIY
jgi:hypothetical protein